MSSLSIQNDSAEVRLADLYEMDNELNALGYRYYTLDMRSIPYKSPPVTTHPVSVKAKEAADNLNQAYLDTVNVHQAIKSKLNEFKKLTGQPEYTDLASCFSSLKSLAGENSLSLVCKEETNDPLELTGGGKAVEKHVQAFNEMLDNCHQFLSNVDVYLDTIQQRIAALKLLAVMQQILTICSTFEARAAENVNIFATEIRSLLLDIRAAANQKLK